MRITFVSNYINHHQIPLSNAFYEALGEEYTFIQTEPMEKERKRMGWSVNVEDIPYVLCSYEEPGKAAKLIMESDVVIFGGVKDQEMIIDRLEKKLITFRYSERIYREGQWKFISPRGLKAKFHNHIRFQNAPVYLLCAGGYVASDFHLIHAYKDKMLSFGYFPEFIDYKDAVHTKRFHFDMELLWAGRFIELKHPEMALEVMDAIRNEGINAHMTMIGAGTMLEEIQNRISEMGLEDRITLTGFLTPDKVREYMRRADIYLFSSDYLEGWGAVLNEAMNSGCAIVANEGIGAVPYLIEDGVNGFVYKNGDNNECVNKVLELVRNKELCLKFGRLSYEKIRDEWNAGVAAKRLLALSEELVNYYKENDVKKAPVLSELQVSKTGPVSPAPIIKPGFFT